MLKKVLWKKKNNKKIVAASFGIFIGLFLLLLSQQIYLDIQVVLKGASDNNFLVLNKNPQAYFGKPMHFSEEEIQGIKEQGFIESVAPVVSNQYEVYASSRALGFSTLLFFQSVEKDYLGLEQVEKFTWKEGERLPIVLSSDYLTLYNFGFAPSQGLPRIPAESIQALDFSVQLTGNKQRKNFDAYILGFSRNVNSILVPEEFMAYSNNLFGEKESLPTQVVVSTDNPYSTALINFLAKHNYQISRGGLIGGELQSALYLLLLLMIVIGGTIMLLSLMVFVLNFQLMIAQASQQIKLLLELGYEDKQLTKVLNQRLVKVFALVALALVISLVPSKYFISKLFIEQGYSRLSTMLHWSVIMAIFIALFSLVLINYRNILKHVKLLGQAPKL